MELYSTRKVLDLGIGGSAEQHQFTDDVYGTGRRGQSYTTVVIDGVGIPEEQRNQPALRLLLRLPPGALGIPR